jgi:hypothetical protein
MYGPRRLRHQPDVKIVQFLGVHIELNHGHVFIGWHLRLRIPEESFAVARAVVDIDIDV